MILDWFNSREAVEVGTVLADRFLSNDAPRTARGRAAHRTGNAGAELQRFLQQATQRAKSLKLNVYKRAKLLSTFKWRLLEHGFDASAVEELTHLLTLQLSGAPPKFSAESGSGLRKSGNSGSARRLPGLLAKADACFTAGQYAECAQCFACSAVTRRQSRSFVAPSN
jgi:hypothetical protein